MGLRQSLTTGAALWLLLGITMVLYWPGLPGPFMLDDIPNLVGLSQVRAPSEVGRMLEWVLMGNAGPLGRHLSYASFLLNDYTWPTVAKSFRYTNVCIHVLTGALLFWLLHTLLAARDIRSSRAATIALGATALWLLHPLNVFTVLYVVQRMTELAAMFVVAGLVAYTKGRLLAPRNSLAGYLLMSAGIGLGGLLGVFSKENAVLIVLFALVIEYTVLRNSTAPRPRRWHLWAVPFLYLPTLALLGSMAYLSSRAGAYRIRTFTLGERVLTEPRVLFDYLSNILIPRRLGTGLFHDDFALSTTLLQPPETLLAVAALVALLVIGFAAARRAPVLAFGILWFFAGHLLESSVVPLELYFEHRNYLPMVGPLFTLTYYAVMGFPKLARLLVPALCCYVLLTAFVSWQQIHLWTKPILLAETWAQEHPGSGRAQQFAADRWSRAGRPDLAERRLRQLMKTKPEQSSLWVQLVWVNCLQGKPLKDLDFDRVLRGINTGLEDSAVGDTVEVMLKQHAPKRCDGLGFEQLQQMLDAAIGNPSFQRYRKRLAQLHFFKSKLYAAERRLEETVRELHRAFDIDPRVEYPIIEARILASAHLYADALLAIARARTVDSQTVLDIPVKTRELDNLERLVLEDKARYHEQFGNTDH